MVCTWLLLWQQSQDFTPKQPTSFEHNIFVKTLKSTRCVCIYVKCSIVGDYLSRHFKKRPRCYAKSPTVQDTFQPIPGLISYAGVTRDGNCYFMHKCSQVAYVYVRILVKCCTVVEVNSTVYAFNCVSHIKL